ncbi:predicted protein [Histoplasma capsulatum H143]|uniref:Uncharacterized protein n=1 Tax=Ajellomyces capsulatus (strain H143) TaxID=544712 RepID=C6HGK5_AJECH|nr:predicted protein [Histoplasma capsulatum H143]
MFIFTLEEAAVVTAFLKLAAELLALPNFGWIGHLSDGEVSTACTLFTPPCPLFWKDLQQSCETLLIINVGPDISRASSSSMPIMWWAICSSKYQALTAVDSLHLWVHTFSTDVTAKAMDNTWTDSQEYRDYTIGERVFLGAGNASCQSLNAATYHIQNLTLRIALLIHQPTGSVKGESRHSQLIMQRTFLYHSTFAFSQMVTD